MSGARKIIIVGGGPAGVAAAMAARQQDAAAEVVLLNDEHHEPYEKPPLSKAVLTGKLAPHDTPIAGPKGIAATGVALKGESIGLAVMTELPLVVVNVQRGGPSTGLPTKTEQSDLLQAMYGRNGEAPVPIVAPQSPGDCFAAAVEAVRIAVTYRTPVMLLSDGYLANGSEPWRIPGLDELPVIDPAFAVAPAEGEEFMPYSRDAATLARPWAIPGTPGLEHRIGGLEKGEGHGNISYDPANHDLMVRTRQAKVDRIAESLPPLEVDDPSGSAKVLVVGWGSTYGPIGAACRRVRTAGGQVAQLHLRHLNPFPKDLGEILKRYDRVLVPEMNLGQLSLLLRGKYLVDALGYNQVNGMPIKAAELAEAIGHLVADAEGIPADQLDLSVATSQEVHQ